MGEVRSAARGGVRGRTCTELEPCPEEFRDAVVNVARSREAGQTLQQIAAGLTETESDAGDRPREIGPRRVMGPGEYGTVMTTSATQAAESDLPPRRAPVLAAPIRRVRRFCS